VHHENTEEWVVILLEQENFPFLLWALNIFFLLVLITGESVEHILQCTEATAGVILGLGLTGRMRNRNA
jgi:hypothetical protein